MAVSPPSAESQPGLAERLQAVRQALPPGTRLLAVTKGHPAELVRQAG